MAKAQAGEPIRVRLSFTRGTKHKYVYESPDDGAVISTLYVHKRAYGQAPPPWVVVRVVVSKAFSGPSAETAVD